MARAVAMKENGRWVVLVDVDQYGGERMSVAQARNFSSDVQNAARDARVNNERDSR